jgi:hypothetical protein
MPPSRLAAIALACACACALGLAACGADDDTRRERLESSLVDATNAALEQEGSYGTAIAARCTDGGPRARCDVGVTNGGTAYEDRYGIVVGADGCWRAVRDGIRHAETGHAEDDPPPRVIEGCER